MSSKIQEIESEIQICKMKQVEYLLEQAVWYLGAGRLDDSEEELKKIIELNSKNVDAIHLLAIVNKNKKKYQLSHKFFDQALKLDPTFSKIWFNKGLLCHEQGDLEKALYCYKKTVQLDASDNDACLNLGNLQIKLGNYLDAFNSYQKAFIINPKDYEAITYSGFALHKLGQNERALQEHKIAIDINPGYYLAWANLGLTLIALGQFKQALQAYDKAVNLNNADPLVWSNRGLALDQLKLYGEALNSHENAILLEAENHEVWSNKGITLHAMCRYEEALQCYEKAINIAPNYHPAWSNLGVTLHNLNRFDEAVRAYHRALAIEPTFDEARWNLGIAELTLGDFQNGFRDYEFRWKINASKVRRYDDIPRLIDLTKVIGKKLLIWHEQGYGDTIQFCRYVNELAKLKIKVILEVQAPLEQLFKHSFPECSIVSNGESLEKIDYQIPVMSLPLFFLESDKFFLPNSYLKTSPEKSVFWRNKLGLKNGKLNVGIACSGNADQSNDKNRSMAIKFLGPLLNQVNIFLIQKEIRDSDKYFFGNHPEIIYLGDEISTFEDSAAIVEQMDLVITVCTSLAHLSGTLGKQTWVCLPWCPDWRWGLNRPDSPWYPTIKLFRQPKFGDWGAVMEEVISALEDLRKNNDPPLI